MHGSSKSERDTAMRVIEAEAITQQMNADAEKGKQTKVIIF